MIPRYAAVRVKQGIYLDHRGEVQGPAATPGRLLVRLSPVSGAAESGPLVELPECDLFVLGTTGGLWVAGPMTYTPTPTPSYRTPKGYGVPRYKRRRY